MSHIQGGQHISSNDDKAADSEKKGKCYRKSSFRSNKMGRSNNTQEFCLWK